jgi:hypothetical protein
MLSTYSSPKSLKFAADGDKSQPETPRSAMTLSRREMLEQWRASKRQKAVDQSACEILTENLPYHGNHNGNCSNHPPSSTGKICCESSISTSVVRGIIMAEKHDEEVDVQIQSKSEKELPDDEIAVMNETHSEIIDTVDSEAQTLGDQSSASSTDNDARIPEIVLPIAPSLPGDQDRSTPPPQNEEYDVVLLMLANDTLVQQLAECEARRIAECSRLRQERDEIKLELSMQEARFKVHAKRMEHAMQQGLMASLERIQELSAELEAAHVIIESLQQQTNHHSEQ